LGWTPLPFIKTNIKDRVMPQDRHESVQEIAKRLEGAQACVRHRHRQVLAYGRL
jgi:hypothetical protein